MSNPRRAFTIVELMVVISIITLLVALILPNFGTSREAAHAAICASNTRQLSIACSGYTDEYNGRFPSAFNWILHVTCWHDWHQTERIEQGSIYEYVKDKNAFMCPRFLATWQLGDRPPAACTEPVSTIKPAYSYSMNASIGWQGWAGSRWPKLSNIYRPSELLFISEESTWAVPPYSSVGINNAAIGKGADSIASYHFMGSNIRGGRGNVSFFDGHARLADPSETNALCSQ
jgi:prepilin-type N-terminal cleavage/methylation domain-containing protein/prepilin-type processing-associated H-X9-DG protein